MMTKRGNGEGSIYQDSRGLWRATVSLPGGKRKYLSGRTRQEVSKKLAAALTHADKGLPFTPERLTTGAYLNQWLRDVQPTVKPKTYASYEQLVRVHILPALGTTPLARLQAADIKRFLADRDQAGLSPRTRQYLLAVLHMALRSARESELIARNVAELVKAPHVPQHEIQPLDEHDVAALLNTSRGHRFEHLFGFLLGSGLRLGEALALRWADVDRGHASINVAHTLERLPGKPWRIADPKSASGRRVVPLIGPAASSLRAQRTRVADMRMAARHGSGGDVVDTWTDHDLVFPSANGNPLSATNVYHEFQKVCARAGLRKYRIHDLRHSTATYLLAARVDPRVVMAVMGWSQVSMLKRYQHVMDPMLKDAAARLEAVFPAASASTGGA
jgi:integrase